MNKKFCMVSVLMVTYNHEAYLRQAIESVIMQVVKFDYEIIIGDDASTDSTQNIIMEYQTKYPDKVRVILRDKNVGPTRNAYDVQMTARGKYIAILEGDDFWVDKNKLQKQVDFLESHQDYIGCASKLFKVSDKGVPMKVRYAPNSHYNRRFSMDDFLKGRANQLFQSGSIVHRNIFRNSNRDLTILYKGHPMIGDGTLLSILLDLGDFYLLSEQMSAYRIIRKATATNAVSLMSRNALEYTRSVLKYAKTLESYFDGKYNFTFMKNMAIDFSLKNYKRLNAKEKKELKGMLRECPITRQLRIYSLFIKSNIRYIVLYIPKKLLGWS